MRGIRFYNHANFFTDIGVELKDERDVLSLKINGIAGLFSYAVGSLRRADFDEYLLLARPKDQVAVYEAIDRFNHA
ncbi:protein of unknown function (plasmid) [Shinella sp. WSC3-e]|nr:hypothetical protein SHINE37_100037 [Rhizobiaceae bacterium]CAK7261575.1 protein of unknown function [Shinella sp. WSC3-e]